MVTVTVARPLYPSLVAVIVAEPIARPVTRPLGYTTATVGSLLRQVTVRPVSGLPLASFTVAVSCTACPAATFVAAGLTVTDATGTLVTVMAALSLCPSLVALMVAEPATFPLTSPLPFTDATVVFELAHVTVRPLSGFPFESFGVAVSWIVAPTGTVADAG